MGKDCEGIVKCIVVCIFYCKVFFVVGFARKLTQKVECGSAK